MLLRLLPRNVPFEKEQGVIAICIAAFAASDYDDKRNKKAVEISWENFHKKNSTFRS